MFQSWAGHTLFSPDLRGSGKWTEHEAFQEGSVRPTVVRMFCVEKACSLERQGPLETLFSLEESPQGCMSRLCFSHRGNSMGLAVSEEAWDKLLY